MKKWFFTLCAVCMVPLLLAACGGVAAPLESGFHEPSADTVPEAGKQKPGEPPPAEAAQPVEEAVAGAVEPNGTGPVESPAEPAQAEPDEGREAWVRRYAEYLEQKDCYGFYMGDINGDGFPEVVICYTEDDMTYETNSGAVGYFTEEGFQELELWVVSVWGKVGYLAETNQIIFLHWYGHTHGTFGSVDFYLYDWTPDGYIETRSVIRDSGYYSSEDGAGVYGQGYINGEEVDTDQFEAALAEMYARLEKSRWFPMTGSDEIEDYYDYLTQWELAYYGK